MSVGREDFAEDWTAELALNILMEPQGYDILDGEGGSADGVFVELADIG